MRTTKALAGVALALTALLTVTACGSSTGGSSTEAAGNGVADKSAEEILAAAEKAADRIIDEVWQLREGAGSAPATPPAAGDAK